MDEYKTKVCCFCGLPTKGRDPKGWATGFASTAADLCPNCLDTIKTGDVPRVRGMMAREFHDLNSVMVAIHAALLVLLPEVIGDSYLQEKADTLKHTLNRFCSKDDIGESDE